MTADVQGIILGFGLGGVGGAMIADFIHLSYMQTPLFILCGIIGAGLVAYTGDVFNPAELLR